MHVCLYVVGCERRDRPVSSALFEHKILLQCFAGEPELACAPAVTGHPISVYQRNSDGGIGIVSRYAHEPADKDARPADPASPIALFFHRLGHYDLLIPVESARPRL